MQIEKLRSLIRESINEYIREIDHKGTDAMLEAKKLACEEAIKKREDKLRSIDENEELKEMVDGGKLKEIEKEIKELKNYHKKLENLQKKHASKGQKKEVTTDTKIEEAPIDEADVTAQMEMKDEEVKEEALNESFLKMQKLAGVITEGQYRKKVQMLSELEAKDVKKGETYMYKWSDKYAPIKVKILGGSSWGDDTFTVEALEDKDGLKQGNQYNAKAEALSPMM